MLIKFTKNPFKLALGIVIFNIRDILAIVIINLSVYLTHDILGYSVIELPIILVSVLGGGIAIFLGFQNNTAYDRWWEARKIWGGIINNSRSFAMEVMSLMTQSNENETEKMIDFQKEIINRQIAWVNSLKDNLTNKNNLDKLKPYLNQHEYDSLKSKKNSTTYLNHLQGMSIKEAFNREYIDTFKQIELTKTLKRFYDLQGSCERIKKTVFPLYYTFFTKMFLWLFILFLPITLVKDLSWGILPFAGSISFVFAVLLRTGSITKTPFENQISDIPLDSICNTIEIDMLQQLGETNLPETKFISETKFGTQFIR